MIHEGRFQGKVVVITGGAGAFGTEIGRHLSGEGASVVLADLDADAAERVATALGGTVASCGLDVTQSDSAAAAMAFAEETFGGSRRAGEQRRPHAQACTARGDPRG